MVTRLLIVDDDEDDRQILTHVLAATAIKNPVTFVTDGVELLDFLKRIENEEKSEITFLVLLDLNMPKLSGMEVLREMKAHPVWKKIPVIIFSTSDYEKDIEDCYAAGASSYIVKPLGYARLVDIFNAIKVYWLERVKFPFI